MSVFPGSPYAQTTPSDPSSDTTGFLRSVRRGLSIIQVSLLLNIVMILLVLGIALLPLTGVRLDGELGDAIGYGVLGLSFVYVLLNCIGTYFYTARDRRLASSENGSLVRTLQRVCVTTSFIGFVIGMVMLLQGMNVEPTSIVQGSNPPDLRFNAPLFALTVPVGLASYIGALSMIVYTRWLARRVDDDPLQRTCTWTMVLIGVVYLFTSVAQVFGATSVHWALMQLRLDPMVVLAISLMLVALPLVALLAMYNTVTATKRVLHRLA